MTQMCLLCVSVLGRKSCCYFGVLALDYAMYIFGRWVDLDNKRETRRMC